jgi:hypothetical protein
MATDICIPAFLGVPGLPGPPNFLTTVPNNRGNPGQDATPHDGEILDPRWEGATRFAFGTGTTPIAYFRGLRDPANGLIYMIWHQRLDTNLDPGDLLYLGFSVPGQFAQTVIIEPVPSSAAATAQPVKITSTYNFDTGTNKWTTAGAVRAKWFDQDTVSWVVPSASSGNVSQGEWAVAMRIPLQTADVTMFPDRLPVGEGGTFQMFFYLLNKLTAAGIQNDSWLPQELTTPTLFPGNLFTPPNPTTPTNWASVQVGGTCNDGISIDVGNVWVEHLFDPVTGLAITASPPPPSGVIDLGLLANGVIADAPALPSQASFQTVASADVSKQTNNLFVANITNNTSSSIPADGSMDISATFRLANWGSNSADDPTWRTVASSDTVEDATGLARNCLNAGPIAPGTQGPIKGLWRNGDFTGPNPFYLAFPPSPTASKGEHQCMLVEIDATGVLITQDSVVRNMDFATASLLERTAEISVRSLPPDPFGTGSRTIYLAVKRSNLPPSTAEASDRARQMASLLWQTQGNLAALRAGSGAGSGSGSGSGSGVGAGMVLDTAFEFLEQFVPTINVFVFHETGFIYSFNSAPSPVLESQPAFGLFLDHQGALLGWDYQIVGAELIAPDFWRLRVPNGGFKDVILRVLAKENPGDAIDHSGDSPTASFGGLCLYGKNSLTISDRVQVLAPGGAFGAVASAGATNVGTDTKLGNVVSVGAVQLRDRAHVNGFVKTGQGVILGNSVQITGGTTSHAAIRLPNLNLQVTFPAANQGPVSLEPGTKKTIGPGAYGGVSVKSRATLTLAAGGVYFFDSLMLEPQSTVVLASGGAQVTIYVRLDCTIRGQLTQAGGGAPNLFLGALGSNPVSVEVPFSGTLVAPNATLALATVAAPGYTGAFFAANLVAQPGSVFNFATASGTPAIDT